MPSNKNINQVEQLSESFSKAKAIYFTEYHGLDVQNITRLRKLFFEADVDYKVAKNTLIKLAIDDNEIPSKFVEAAAFAYLAFLEKGEIFEPK